MKLFKRTKKTWFKFNIEFQRAVLWTISVSKRNLWNHLSNPCSKRRGRNNHILLIIVISSRLKTSPYKGGTKIFPYRFSCHPASHTYLYETEQCIYLVLDWFFIYQAWNALTSRKFWVSSSVTFKNAQQDLLKIVLLSKIFKPHDLMYYVFLWFMVSNLSLRRSKKK